MIYSFLHGGAVVKLDNMILTKVLSCISFALQKGTAGDMFACLNVVCIWKNGKMHQRVSLIRRHKILVTLVVLLLAALGFLAYRMKGPYRSYHLDFIKTGNRPAAETIQVGVALRDITPDMDKYDTFVDADNDNAYKPESGFFSLFRSLRGPDSYVDRNGNGRFDAAWMTGFTTDRPAKGVHDPIDVRAIVLENNGLRIALVSLDAIGMFNDKVIDIRKRIDPALNIDHVVVSCVHNHETPDTMGIYSGPIPTPWAFDTAHMEKVLNACKEAVEEAAGNLQPAEMYCVTHELAPEGFVRDSRLPTVIDTQVHCVRFIKPGTDATIATLLNWGNHPETLGGKNPYITADFPGYWRNGVEKGVPEPNGVPGLGGMCLYFQGMLGGLMTQLELEVPHRDGVRTFTEDSFEKAEALGQNLAIETVNALRSDKVWKNAQPALAVGAKSIYGPVRGIFGAAIMTGLIHPGIFWPFNARSEINVVRIGEVKILTVPGELYPEIGDGGIENPPGADFYPLDPVETPPLRKEIMHGKMRMVFGLANDEIGYIIPKSQWDAEPPYAYTPEGQYGEQNSLTPELAPLIHRECKALLDRLHAALDQKQAL